MESPATWDEPTKVVAEALRKVHENDLKPIGEMVFGMSTPGQIVTALRQAGFCLGTHAQPTPENIAMAFMRSEPMMWMMAGANHPDAHLSVLRAWWRRYIDAGGPTYGNPRGYPLD